MKLKTKLTISLLFLFIVILIFGILGIFYINRLSKDADVILKNNHESLVYCNNMLKALEDIPLNHAAEKLFEQNLLKQELNITEPGENEATTELRKNFNELIADPFDSSNYPQIRESIHIINDLNQDAILRKNTVAKKTAEKATLWMSIIFTVLALISLTLVVNLPGIISNPIHTLSEGINEIANKNYSKRIFIKQHDEFGKLADAFNIMASKLDEYESSTLAKIKFEKSRIETIINQMNDGIIGLDEQKKILFLNGVAENLLELKEKDIAGKHASDIALKNDLMRAILQDESKKDLKIYANNKESYFNKDILNVKNTEQVIGQVIVLRNITPFHELDVAKTNFIATISHELKTPLASSDFSLKLLEDERVSKLSKEQKELIENLKLDNQRMLKILSDLLNLSQVEAGRIQLNIKKVAPVQIIENAIQAVTINAREKEVIVKKIYDKNLPEINADADKTAWVLNNFLTNAIKYSYNNSSIEAAITKEGNNIIFSVKDYGPGINEEYLPKLFERYFQVPGSKEKGTGLGLAISKEFVEAQGGNIWVESEVAKGSSFYFSLPI